jgi:hypothetical protein
MNDFVCECQPVLSAATEWGSIAHPLQRTKDQGPFRDHACMCHFMAACRRRARKAQERLRPGQWLKAWTPFHAHVRGMSDLASGGMAHQPRSRVPS